VIQINLQHYDPRATLEARARTDGADKFAAFGSDGLTFSDIIDVINPLQHIPVIGTLYRKLTGDVIDPATRIAGGALFGGPIGAAFSAVAVAIGEARKAILEPASEPGPALAEAKADRDVKSSSTPPPPSSGFMPVSLKTEERTEIADKPAGAFTGTDGHRPRRGGWMVAYAYSGSMPSATERRMPKANHIDVSV